MTEVWAVLFGTGAHEPDSLLSLWLTEIEAHKERQRVEAEYAAAWLRRENNGRGEFLVERIKIGKHAPGGWN